MISAHKHKVYFNNLDSIRFIAALMVVMAHAFMPSYHYEPIRGTFMEKILLLISNGQTGVTIFFVLSGFLITYLLITEHELNGKVGLGNFYIRRILRIWPLYFFVVVFSFLIYPFLKSLVGIYSPLSSNVLYHLSFLSNFDVIRIQKCCGGHDAMIQNITWSVSIEEQFYLFWPLIFALIPIRFWLHSIFLVIASSLAFRIVNHKDIVVLYFHTFSVFAHLAIGGLLAYAVKKFERFRVFFENVSTRKHMILFVVSFILLLFADKLFSFVQYGYAIGQLLISFSIGFIIVAQALGKKPSMLQLSNIPFFEGWGKYTYGLYLLHPIAILIVDIASRLLLFPKDNFVNLFLMGILSLILSLLISRMSYHYFELRFLALKDKFSTIQTHQ